MPLSPEALKSVQDFVAREIAAGFETRDQIITHCAVYLTGSGSTRALKAAARQAYRSASRAHTISKRAWPKTTDCDRLDAAFDDLNARGIMARHNWTCCQTCGHAEMPDEYDRIITNDPTTAICGYCFYHMQDLESAAQGHGIYLAYDALPGGSQLAIGREVAAALKKRGLTVQWNGKTNQRIGIPMNWQRRKRPKKWVGE